MGLENKNAIARIRYGSVVKDVSEGDDLILGRTPECDFFINHELVSRKHIRILGKNGKIVVVDLGSANGTYVADEEVEKNREYTLSPMTSLAVGDREVKIDIEFVLAQDSIQLESAEKTAASTQAIRLDLPSKTNKVVTEELIQIEAKQAQIRSEIDALYGIRDTWKKKIAELQEQSEVLTAEIVEKSQKNVVLLDHLRETGDQLARADADLEGSRNKLQDLHEQVTATQQAERAGEERVRLLSAELKQVESRIAEVNRERERAVQVCEDARAETLLLRNEASERRSEVSQRLEEVGTLEAKFQDLRAEVAKSVAEKEKVEKAIDQLAARLQKAQADAEIENTNRAVQRGQLEVELQNIRAQKAKLEADLAVLKVESELEKHAFEKARLGLEQSEERRGALTVEAEKITEQIESSTQKQGEIQGVIRSLAELKDGLGRELEKLAGDREAQLVALKRERDEFDARLAAEKSAVLDEERRYQKSEREKWEQELHDRRSKLRDEEEKVKNELAAARAKLSSESDVEKEKIRANKEMQVAELTAERARLAMELKGEKDKFDQVIASQKKTTELQIAEMKVREMAEAENRRLDEEKAAKARRQHEAGVLGKRLEQVVGSKLLGLVGESKRDEVDKILRAIPETIHETLFPKKFQEEEATPAPVSLDPESSARALKFWVRSGWAAGIIAFVLITFLLFPGLGSGVKRTLASWLISGESESDLYVKRLRELRAALPKYAPEIDRVYKASYAENVIKLERYVEFKEDSDIRKKWILELNKFFLDELKLREHAIVQFSAVELAMIRELQQLREMMDPKHEKEGLARMAEVEAKGIQEIKDIVGENGFGKLREFEQGFYDRLIVLGE